jgi:phosphatidylglycerol:prolipoprotein diacylglycerol transferase
MLTEQQKEQVKTKYHCLAVHPTQLYSSLNAAIIAFVLFLLWRRGVKYKSQSRIKPGTVSAIMLILYGTARFGIEFLRDDNPYELDGLTVSQNISITLFVAGVILLILFQKIPINKG